MSLSGTLETFALPDVLALLSATKKTGELQVNGGRGEARVWLDKGEMVAADVPKAATFVDAVFEMLRLTSGKFAFDNDGTATNPGDPMALEPLLLEAQSRLGEWRSIEAVVPSTGCAVSLVPKVSGAQVTLTAEQWRALVAVAASPDVEAVSESLGLGEFAGCRMVKDLVQSGLVDIGEAPAPKAKAMAKPDTDARAVAEPANDAAPEATSTPELAADAEPAAPRVAPSRPVNPSALAAARNLKPGAQVARPTVRPAQPAAAASQAEAAAEVVEAPKTKTTEPAPPTRPRIAASLGGATDPVPAPKAPTRAEVRQPAASKPAAAARTRTTPDGNGDTNDDDAAAAAAEAAELVHQLAHLSDVPTPAASTVAHATNGSRPPAKATPDPATEDPEKPEEPLNRGLLLKFLNSVRS